MSLGTMPHPKAHFFSQIIRNPNFTLVATLAVLVLISSMRLVVPVGPMLWDTHLYYDAVNRIMDGQIPNVDFFTPVGPLTYYLMSLLDCIFPDAQPTLILHWSLLLISAPLIALVVGDVSKRSRAIGFALLIPFLIFAVLPFNNREYYPFPGSVGFGIYNRHISQLLYILAASLLFVKERKRLVLLVAATMLALFLVKITGFISGALLCIYALLAGRLRFRGTVIAGLGFLAVLGALELSLGMISAYIGDIAQLVEMNTGSLLPRMFQSASQNFAIIASASALILLLLYAERKPIAKKIALLRSQPNSANAASLLDMPALWLAIILCANIFIEAQNTGSQAMISLWPAILLVLAGAMRFLGQPKLLIAIAALAAAVALPPVVNVSEQAGRTYLGATVNEDFANRNLGKLGDFSMRPDIHERLGKMIDFYPDHRQTYEDFAKLDILPANVFYSEYDFQLSNLAYIDQAIDAIRALEAQHDLRFQTIMSLNFSNIFPYLMGRSGTWGISIGADPTRTTPEMDEETAEHVAATDLVLLPTCPLTSANMMLSDHYAPALTKHRKISLTKCYEALIRPDIAARLGLPE